jgi:hypothetical protein
MQERGDGDIGGPCVESMAVGGGQWRRIVVRRVLLLAVVLVLVLPWLGHVFTHLPADDASDDAWLIVWVLDWVHNALATAPRGLFDPPVNHPAPGQLAGSEHFLSSQLLFAPLRWLAGSSVAAANLTALLSYVLAVACMDVLLIALGIEPWAAFVVALSYGFGWQGRPGRLHILQSQHFYVPLAALALHRLRERPTRGRALAVTAVLTAGLLSSYHMAVYLTVGMTVWGTAECLRAGDGRGRYAGRAIAAGVVAAALLVTISIPYLLRPEAHGGAELAYSRWRMTHLESEPEGPANADLLFVLRSFVGCAVGGGQSQSCLPVDWLAERVWTLARGGALPSSLLVVPALVLIGFADAARTASPRRQIFLAGAAFVLTGVLLAGPAYCTVAGMELPLPAALLAASPARFIRVPDRALVLAFFGGALLVACGLDVGFRRLGRPARLAAVVLLTLATVFRFPLSPAILASKTMPRMPWEGLQRFGRLSPVRYLTNPALGVDAPSYAAVAEKVRALGPGPLLDLPVTPDGTAVMGQMVHRQPTICFYTGYLPVHVSMVERLIAELPHAAALDDLIDMTELRWIVLRPEHEWPSAKVYRRHVDALRAHPRVITMMAPGDFTLVQLDPRSHRPDWPRSLAAGPRRGVSSLGTPLVRLPAGQAFVRVHARPRATAGLPVPIRVAVANESSRAWAASPPARPGVPLTVRLELKWTASGDPDDEAARETFELRRDVLAGEKIGQVVRTTAPERPGRYRIEVAVRQVEGADLASPQNPASTEVEITP